MIKKYLLITLLFIGFVSCQSTSKVIKTKTPERPKGQTHVVGLTTPKLDTVRIGIVGLGMRGISAVERFIHIPGVEIKALCDIRPELTESLRKRRH